MKSKVANLTKIVLKNLTKKPFFSAASEDPGGARQCEGPQPPRSQDELQKVTFAFNLHISWLLCMGIFMTR